MTALLAARSGKQATLPAGQTEESMAIDWANYECKEISIIEESMAIDWANYECKEISIIERSREVGAGSMEIMSIVDIIEQLPLEGSMEII
jgi:hypothetical protein